MGFLKGDVSVLPLVDLLGYLLGAEKEGTLTLEHSGEIRTLELGKHRVRLNRDEEKSLVRKLLVQRKSLSDKQIDELFQSIGGSGPHLADHLEKNGTLARFDIRQAVQTQFEELLLECLFWKEVRFEFREDRLSSSTTSVCTLGSSEVYAALGEALQRAEDWRLLPACEPPAPVPKRRHREPSAPAQPAVLLADEDRRSRKIMSYFVQSLGCEPLEAADGEEAWRLARSRSPRLVVAGKGLPKLSGLELCRKIRTNRSTRGIAVLLVGNTTRSEEIAEAREVGATDYLPTPFQREQFLSKVRTIVGV